MASKKVKVYIDADARGLDRGLRGANAKLGGFGKKAIGAAAGFVSVGAALNEVKKSVGVVTTLAKGTAALSRQTGMDTEEASRWVAVARSRNIESAKLGTGFTALSKQIKAATDGSKASADAFKQLGLSQGELKTSDVSRIIARVSDGMEKMGPGAERSALASRLFGRSYQTLLPILGDGSKKLEENLALSDKFGLTLNGKTSKAALSFVAKQREMNMALDGLRVQLGAALLPALTTVTAAVTSFIASFRAPEGFGRDLIEKAQAVADEVSSILEDAGIKAPTTESDYFDTIMTPSKSPGAATYKQDLITTLQGIYDAGGSIARSSWNKHRQELVGSLRGLSGTIKVLGGVLRGDWSRVISGLADEAGGLARLLIGKFTSSYSLIIAAGKKLGGAVISGMKSQFPSAYKAASDLITGVKNGIIRSFAALKSAGKRAADAARDGVASIWARMYAVGGFLMDKIKDGLSAGVGALSSIGSKIVSAIKSGIGGVISIPFRLFGKGKASGGRAERGGMLTGWGLKDTVPVMAAPGEAFLTRHQQVPVEAALGAFGMSLDDVFKNRRPHSMSMQFAKGGYRAKQKKKWATKVKKFNRNVELQDAKDAAYTDPKYDVNLTKRLARIDQLLKSKYLSREDRVALLNQRGQVVDAMDQGEDTSTQDLAAAIAAQTAAIQENTDQQRQNLDFAERMHTATKGVTDTLLQGVVDKTIGGQLSTWILTSGPRTSLA